MTSVASRSALDRVARNEAAELLARAATLLCSPLCVASGRVPRVVSWLATAGFEVPWLRRQQLQRAQIDSLWEELIPTISRRRVEVVTASMTAAPAVLLGLRHPAADVTATELLVGMKGSADPGARGAQTLRSHLGAPNLLTSLVHSPDTPAHLLRELQVLLPRSEDLVRFWRVMHSGASRDTTLPADLTGEDPPPAVTALIVGLRLRYRLLERLADGASGALAQAVGEAFSTVGRALTAAEQSDPFSPQAALTRYRAGFEPHQPRLHRAVRLDADLGHITRARLLACAGYAELDLLAAGEPFDLDLLTAGLQGAGVVPTRWEHVVLASEWVTQPNPTTPTGQTSRDVQTDGGARQA